MTSTAADQQQDQHPRVVDARLVQPVGHPPHGDVRVWAAQQQPQHPQHPQQLGFGPGPSPYPASLPVEPQAVVSLVLGGVSLLLSWIFGVSVLALAGGVAAVVCGVVALRRLKTGQRSGKGLAIAGLSCGSVAVVIAGVVSALFFAWLAVFGGLWSVAWGSALNS
ncbi:MAG: hypothetical protein PGN11_07210 [Quadrisphaera sp.]